MPEAGGPAGGPRLSDLESRWRFDRSPRVFLQLADELRRTGALPRAIDVLQEGLSHHPESVSGRVALGRAQLEAGDASAAAETLERVLARDPAQIVASKLLIETWIRMGDAARARERLDIYRILQERDGEIDEYERRIAAMERSERMPAVFELAGGSAPATDPGSHAADVADAGFAAPAEPIFDLGSARELPPLALAPELAPTVSPVSPIRPAVSAEAAPTSARLDPRTPFGVVHEPAASGARILSFFRSEAIFALAPPVAPAVALPELAPEAMAGGTEVEPSSAELAAPAVDLVADADLAAIEPEPMPSAAPAAFFSTAPAPTVDLAPAAEPEAPSELAPGMTFEQFSTTGFAAEVERESLVEPLADVLSRAGLDAEAMPAIEHPVPEETATGAATTAEPEPPALGAVDETVEMGAVGAGDALVDRRGAEPAREPLPAPASSATLARLYLEQGHLAEAEAEFRKVLEARPDDESALAGLRDVGRRRSGDETVSGWGAATPASPRPPRAVGLTQRKVETLRAYLERIRRGRARSNVS